MDNIFKDSITGCNLLIEHPVPWCYSKGGIFDANGASVVHQDQVSNVVFDTIWQVYFDYLRD